MRKEKVDMDPTDEKKSLNRREALKTIAASAGALGAAAFLPGKWSKPLVELGVLPAHAQGTIIDLVISDLRFRFPTSSSKPNEIRYGYFASFDYLDPLGKVNTNAKLYANATPCGETYYSGETLSNIASKLTGTAYNGSILFNFNTSLTCANGSQLNVQLGANGRMSNVLSGDIPLPEA
jgi:hypothetical protein